MDMKYYDLLSTAIIGVVTVVIVNNILLGNTNLDSVSYLSLGYLTGYFINSIGSVLEVFYYKTIGGKPSDKLLTPVAGRDWTGCRRIRFYEADTVIHALRNELNDKNASVQKMFGYAMRKVSSCQESRIPIFNAQYAWSRTILTTVWILSVLFATHFYNEWYFWLISLILLMISWTRFKERGYYYAREVLNEYLKQRKAK